MHLRLFAPAAAALIATACAAQRPTAPEPAGGTPADHFFAQIAQHCGRAYAGRVVANDPPGLNDPFEGKALVMHVRACGEGQLGIPFHVGEDRSRTWVLTRTRAGLRLEHDHRHADGSSDPVTMYGGETATLGTDTRQEFPVGAASRALFEREGLEASVTNVWALELEPGRRFVYELTRPGRLFRVEFDLTQPAPLPPAAWGHGG